ncbi:MAG: zinc-binding alcohol dehydrogenase family protein [Aliidongia sp.]
MLSLATLPDPIREADTAIVSVKAASINPSDVKNVQGRMAQTKPPRIPGRDYSGVVVAGPAEWIGAEVWGSGGDVGFTRDGTHGDKIAVPVASLRRKPPRLSHEEAASIGVNFIAAWCGVKGAARVITGETLVIIGLGGVGRAAAQIAKRHGARVIGIDRHRPLPDVPVLSDVDKIITPEDGDPVEQLKELTGGGAQIVFDTVGGSMFETAVRMLAHRGRLVEISATDRRQVSFDLADFYHNESQLFGVDTLKHDLTLSAILLEEMASGFEQGFYRPPVIEEVFELEQAQEAYRLVARGTRGRVVLTPAA